MARVFIQRCLMITAVIVLCGSAQAQTQWVLDAGPLKLNICISETANLFNVVDQLSQGKEYVAYFKTNGGLSSEDNDLLARHASISNAKSWKLKQAFYTALELEPALDAAVGNHQLTEAEAQTERIVFGHFKARVDKLIAVRTPALTTLAEELRTRKQELTGSAITISRFVGGPS